MPQVADFKRVFLLALPIIISNLSVPLVGLVDTAVMGRLPDPAYVGAVALGAVTFSSIFWAFGFLRMGTTGLAAQALGRGDGQAIRSLLLTSGLMALGFSLIVLTAQTAIIAMAVWFLGATDAVKVLLIEYIQVRIWSAPAVLLNYLLVGLFIGLQRTGFALISQLGLNLTNAALSVLFVLYWGWGVSGVALASVIGEYLAVALGIVLLGRALSPIAGRWSLAALTDWPSYRRLLTVNADIFIRTLCLLFAFAWFARQGTALGASVLAVNAVLLQFINLLAYGLDGFAHAAEALVGQAVGARSRPAFVAAVRVSTVLALLTSLVYSLAYAIFGADLVAMLTTIESIRSLATVYLPWVVAMPLLAVWSYQLDGIFIGALQTGQMRNAMIISTGLFVPLSLLTIDLFQNHGLWLSLSLFFCLRTATLGAYLRLRPPI